MNRKLLFLALGVFLLTGTGLVVLFTNIPNLIDKEALKTEIEKGLNESTGVRFQIRELTLQPTWTHGIQVHLNTTAIRDLRHRPLGDIKYITVQIRYLPIIFQQLPEIAKIHVREVYIPVGEASLFKEIKLKLVKPKRTGFLKPAELHDTEILVSDYRIEDEAVANTVGQLLAASQKPVKSFHVTGESITIRHLESRKPVEIEGAGFLAFLEPAGKPTLPKAHYKVKLAIPQAAVKAKTPQYHNLERLDFDLKSKDVDFQLRYKRQGKKDGKGSFHSKPTDLLQAQTLVMQLSDTFGFELPEAAQSVYISGQGDLNSIFNLRFPKEKKARKPKKQDKPLSDIVIPQVALQGQLNLHDVAVARKEAWPYHVVHHINGRIQMRGETLGTQGIRLYIGNIPFRLRGSVRFNSQQLDLEAKTERVELTSARKLLSDLGVPLQALGSRELGGKLDAFAHLRGSFKNPAYSGHLRVKDGSYSDASLGLSIAGIQGQASIQGIGIDKGEYQSQINLTHADFQLDHPQLTLDDLHGEVRLKGRLVAQRPPERPTMEGWLQANDGTFLHEPTGLLLSRIQGKVLLKPNAFEVPHLQGFLGSALLNASGEISSDFKRYRARVTGQNIQITKLTDEVLAKLTDASLLTSIRPTRGLLNLDWGISTGEKMHGKLSLQDFIAQTDGYPLRIPSLSMLFDGQRIQVQPTTLYYGDAQARLAGDLQLNGKYNFTIATGELPVAMLRDSIGFINNISGLSLPEIWNTAGSFSVDSKLSNGVSEIRVSFNDAGLSWQGGDFPLYNINGRLLYRRIGNGEDFVGTRDLSFRYGNSPIHIRAGSGEHFRMNSEGILSALLMNHFLVSPQSNATPYQEVPFQILAMGELHGLPGTSEAVHNQIATHVRLDLNPTIKDAYKNTLPVPAHLKSIEEPLPPPLPRRRATTEPPPAPGESPIDTIRRRRERLSRDMERLVGRIKERVDEGISRFTGKPTEAPELANTPKPKPASPDRVYNAAESNDPARRNARRNRPAPAQTAEGDDNAYLDARLMLSGNNLFFRRGLIHLFEAGNIVLEGAIQEVFSPDRLFGFHLYTQPSVALDKLSHSSRENDFFREAQGNIEADIRLSGGRKLENIQGHFSADRVAIPYLTLEELTGRIDFLGGEHAVAEIQSFKVPGVEATATATTDSLFELPITLENVKINGALMNIESLQQFNNNIVTPIIIEQLVHNYARPWQQGDPRIPIQFRDGDLHFEEAILQNIIMTNLNSKLSVYANSFFELTNTSLEAAGGKVVGYLSMNPNENNFMTLELNAENVKANALTRALLGVTNQVFGDLSGTVRFTTFGANEEEMQDNANGTVHMKITNGRLPAIAQVEALLATANLLRGGILGFNLNNLFRSLAFYDTNYFAELSGDLLIANGVLYTDNLISDGENLDLVIQGSLDMGTGDADMMVNGRMRQDVSGKLGPLGKLSLGSILRFIPALGTLGPNQPGLLDYLPGVGFIPGFGGPASDFNYFQVRLLGQLDNPSAIQDFRWVKKGS